ncbi:hypothetical protein [Microvirga puerhi]|uniref:Uncharacterized protein n=1 Tax=Microvirga puerhi TaxID=2876078 RepID=A0ABS7VKJ2_9HYPH|nr:hypothetical protein [Microvirga puerhi]MBZ6076056.1 hypothetical protein [Microvirga puerhi]
MRSLLITTIAAAAFALGGSAMAQTPVPNASGSQTTNPQTYGATANQPQAGQQMHPQKRKATPQHHAARRHHPVTTTGSVRHGWTPRTPVPNASGSQVTNPDTYRATAYQHRR